MGKQLPVKWAIITAGGSGNRMGSSLPKQFLELKGWPVLMHTLSAFKNADPTIHLVLVLPEKEIQRWRNLCIQFDFKVECIVAEGGNTRFQSVKNGLNEIHDNNALISVHDGVRPIISPALINRVYNEAERLGNAIPVVPIKESIRKVEGNQSFIANREKYRIIQTPQCFQAEQLKPAFEQPYDPSFTDEANVVEMAGNAIHLVEGEDDNIKVTNPSDLNLAETLLTGH